MRVYLVIAQLITCVASGAGAQLVDRAVPIVHAESPQDFQQIVWVLTTMAGIREISRDVNNGTLAIRGTNEQIALAEWLAGELDRAATHATSHPRAEYPVLETTGRGEVVTVFFLTHPETPQDLQGIAQLVASISRLRQVLGNDARRAIPVRGTKDQIALADWLVTKVDSAENWRPLKQRRPATPASEYQTRDGSDHVVRLLYLAPEATDFDLQEIQSALQSITDTPLVVNESATKTIAFRGMRDNADLAVWLFDELNKPENWLPVAQRRLDTTLREYQMPEDKQRDYFARVLYLPPDADPAELRSAFDLIQKRARIPRVFPCSAARGLAMRGPSKNIAIAEQLVKERFLPSNTPPAKP